SVLPNRERRADAGLQIYELEGLGDEIVGAELHPPNLAVHVADRGEDQHRQLGPLALVADLLEHRKAVLLRHHQVQEHQIRAKLVELAHNLLAVSGHADHEIGLLRELLEQVPGVLVVVDDQDPPRHCQSPLARLSNRVNSDRKIRSMVPIGPLRCLATISSTGLLSRNDIEPSSSSSSRWMNITTSASCSMAPDSRRSDSCGLPPLRSSTLRLSWLSASTGI